MICDYGCGNEALYKINSKNCCSKHYNQCPEVRRKNSLGLKKAFKEGRKNNSHCVKGTMCGWKTWTLLGKGNSKYKYSTEDVFKVGSTYSTVDLKKRLLEGKILEYRCGICGIDSWLGKEIPLDLDHINGNSFDHRVENLRFLCPNCHSQTETYRGRNVNFGKKKVSDEDLLNAIKSEKSLRMALIKVGLAAKGSNYTRAKKLSAQLETTDVEPFKFGEPLTGNPEPSSDKEKV